MTRQQNLDAVIDALCAEMAAVSAHPKPFYVSVDANGMSQRLSAVQYLESLHTRLDKAIEQRQKVDEPFMIKRSRGARYPF